MPLNPKVVIRQGGVHGWCWFAGEDIPIGEWLWRKRGADAPHTDVLISWSELQSWPKEKREKYLSLAYEVEDGMYLGFDPAKTPIHAELIEDYVNHSCDGNGWYNSDTELVAMRNIKKGEEITYDYVLTESNHEWRLAPTCLCGATNCRGVVTGRDYLLPELQDRYGNHFTAHVQKKIRQAKLDKLKAKSQGRWLHEKTAEIAVGFAVILAIGAGIAYFFSQKPKAATNSVSTPSQQTPTPAAAAKRK